MPLVAGSVIFDWLERNKLLYPDKALGKAAYKAARPGEFSLGRRGAGIGARIASFW